MRAALGLLACLLLAACSSSSPRAPISFPSTIPSTQPAPSPTPVVTQEPSPTPSTKPPTTKAPVAGTFSRTASGGTGVMGAAGVLKKYCVQVEDVITTFTPNQVAPVIDQVLGDSRSWIASKRWMFQRVSNCDGANLRIKLAIPRTVDRLCASAGVDTAGKYSCRNGNNIFLNLDRWTVGVAHFPELAVYRNMLINHEVGHYLGFGHVNCASEGQPAPVMQQQSISLRGCQINPHPYPDGVNYVG